MRKMHPKLKEQAELWVRKNNEDWQSARVEFHETRNYGLVCFLCQQIIERYLKICLMFFQGDYPKIHDLLKLLELVKKYDKDILDYREECEFVDKFYIEMRYPVVLQPVSKEDAKKSMTYTESVVRYVKTLMKKLVRTGE